MADTLSLTHKCVRACKNIHTTAGRNMLFSPTQDSFLPSRQTDTQTSPCLHNFVYYHMIFFSLIQNAKDLSCYCQKASIRNIKYSLSVPMKTGPLSETETADHCLKTVQVFDLTISLGKNKHFIHQKIQGFPIISMILIIQQLHKCVTRGFDRPRKQSVMK